MTRVSRCAVILLIGLALIGPAWAAAPDEVEREALKQEVTRRRAELMEKIGPNALGILFSAEVKNYERDVDYPYRQDSNLYYLTGITQSEATLVLVPGNDQMREILFIPDRNPTRETWTGKVPTRAEATQISGVRTVYSASQFDAFLDATLSRRRFGPRSYAPTTEFETFFSALDRGEAVVYLVLENNPGLHGKPNREWDLAHRVRQNFTGTQTRDVARFLHGMRLVKSPYEIAQLRRAIQITDQALNEAIPAIRPGAHEYEIEALIGYVFRKNNASGPGYPPIVGAGPNATILHYSPGHVAMKSGELVLMDVGAEYKQYTADVTRTVPVNGKFTPEQAEIYNIVREAADAALQAVRVGARIPDVHQRAVEVLKDGLLRIGLITDKNSEQYRIWFPHGTSHWLGMNVHDVGERDEPFRPGMVLTVEPGIYVREEALESRHGMPDDEKFLAAIGPALKKYKNIGVRVEDDVLVTENGFELLSKASPRTIPEIEALMRDRGKNGRKE